MLSTKKLFPEGTTMVQGKIDVYNYLDMHAEINNGIIEEFSINKLRKAFPEIDEFTSKDFEADWRTARQRMLNLKFDS